MIKHRIRTKGTLKHTSSYSAGFRNRILYFSHLVNSLMAEWLGWASQGLEMYCHDLEFMGSTPGWVKLGVCSTSIQVALEQQNEVIVI